MAISFPGACTYECPTTFKTHTKERRPGTLKMSSIEAIDVGEAIILVIKAFKECGALHQKWRQLAAAKNAKAFHQSLILGAARVQEEYDQHYGRLGDRFGDGDDVARMELMSIVVKMQGVLITLLQLSTSTRPVSILDCSNFLNISDTARVESIKSLAALFQRLTTSNPLPSLKDNPSQSSDPGAFCIGAVIMQRDKDRRGRDITEHSGSCKCQYCGSILDLRDRSVKVGWMFNPEWVVTADFIAKCHCPIVGVPRDLFAYGARKDDLWASYRCVICLSKTVYTTADGLVKHLRKHGWSNAFRGDSRICKQGLWDS